MNRSNIQTVLRNIVDSGLMDVPSAAYSPTSESRPQKKPSASNSERNPLFSSPYMRKQPLKMDLSHSTLNVEGAFSGKYNPSTMGYGTLGELGPAETMLDDLSESSQQFPVAPAMCIDGRRFKQCCSITRRL